MNCGPSGSASAKTGSTPQPFSRIGQESSLEEGTGIDLELNSPAALQLAVEGAEPTAVAQAQVQRGAPRRTLLYVEDNTADLQLVERLVARRPDLRLLSALNGNLGIEMARGSLPDIILMDITLPGISGIQALNILLEDPVTAHIPVLAISANAMPRDIKTGLEAGFFQYLTKPINLNEFLEAVDVAFEFAEARLHRIFAGSSGLLTAT
jgi:CheY-like chemotaxis protein